MSLLPNSAFLIGFIGPEYADMCRKKLAENMDQLRPQITALTGALSLPFGWRSLPLESLVTPDLCRPLRGGIMETILRNLGRFTHFLLHFMGLPFVPYLNLGYYVDSLYRRALEKNHLTPRPGQMRHIDILCDRYVLNEARARLVHRRDELLHGMEEGTSEATDSPAAAEIDSMAQSVQTDQNATQTEIMALRAEIAELERRQAGGKDLNEECSIDIVMTSDRNEQESPTSPPEDQRIDSNVTNEAGRDSVDALLREKLEPVALCARQYRDLRRIAMICGQLIDQNFLPYEWLAAQDPTYYRRRVILHCHRLETWRRMTDNIQILKKALMENASPEIIPGSNGGQPNHSQGGPTAEWIQQQQEKMARRQLELAQFKAACGVDIHSYAERRGLIEFGLCEQTLPAWNYLISTLMKLQGSFEAGEVDQLSYTAFGISKSGISIFDFLKIGKLNIYQTEAPNRCYHGTKPINVLGMIEEAKDEEDIIDEVPEESGGDPEIP